MAQDKITEIFDITLLNDNKAKFLNIIKEALSDVEKLGQSIKATTTIGGNSDNSAKAAKSINEISFNLKAFNDLLKQNETLMAKYNAMTSDAARENVALKARLSELAKELDNVQEKRKQDATNTKLSNEIKAASDARYIKMYESLLKEKEDLENRAAAAEKERINQSMIARQKSSDARKREIAEQSRLASEAAALEKKEASENKVAEKNVEALNSAYVKLNQQHKSAVMIYQQYAVTLGETNKLTIQAKDNANRLGDQLRSVDAGVGNFKRNVGNYSSAWNGLGMSIQQVAREMPNFAQSMQLGFLAISNNLPILADELKRAKDNIKALKEEGKSAPSLFSQIAASVFSWQTALTIGITLLVKYGAEIVDWASNVSNAEKMMRSYEKALGDTIKSESEGISKLVAAKTALNDNSVSRETQVKLLNEAKAAYPQYLSSLDIELNTTDEINAALQQQMDIRIGIAKTKAAEATLSEATAEQIKAFQELNKEASLWDKFLASFTLKGADADEIYNKLTDSAKELALAEEANWKAGKLTDDQYVVKIKRIIEISDAQKKEAAAVDLVRYANDDLTMSMVKEIAELEKRRIEVTKNIDKYPALLGARRKEIEHIDQTILKLRGEISEREKLLNLQQARVASFGISEEERQLIAAQNYARLFKEGTKERLNADIAAKKIELKVNLKALKDKENVDVSYLASDKNYNQKYATLRAEAISKSNEEILRLQDDFAKKAAKAAKAANKPKPEDKTADIILQQMNDVAENEQININKRLTAIREELDKGLITIAQYQDKKKIIVKEGEDSILQLQIKALDDYLKKIGLNSEGRAKVQEMITTKHKEEIKRRQAADEEASLQDAKLREDNIAYAEELSKDVEDTLKKARDAKKKKEQDDADDEKRTQEEKYRYIQQLAQETTQLIFTLLDAQTQKEISAAEKRSEALTAKYDLERSAIEQANLSDEEKTARKLVLDAEEAESQKKIDNEIRALKRKQAIYDKAQALATIAINTAIALSNPTNLASFGSISPFIIGLAAVQAATVLATPLPEYAKGKKASDSYEGLAIAGEKGTEMKIDKDGSLQLLTKPTLIHTKRGDTILSNRELMSGELGKHIKTGKEKANYDELIKAYSYHTDRTIKAIKNSPSNIIIDNSNYNLSLKRARV
jgi:hypothetical protein